MTYEPTYTIYMYDAVRQTSRNHKKRASILFPSRDSSTPAGARGTAVLLQMMHHLSYGPSTRCNAETISLEN